MSMLRFRLTVLIASSIAASFLYIGLAFGADASVDSKRMASTDKDPGNWIAIGRNYNEQHFSPLKQINDKNVNKLGLAWYYDLNTQRGVEGTPLVVDGVMYNTSAWNFTMALDAATGKQLWTYDPEVQREWGRYACCDVVSRGLAVWKGRVYIATLDGRLIAINATTGKPEWSVQTFDKNWPYSITGAPRVFDGKVVVGNAGADLGVRGFVTAYDADTGKQLWRFFTVPGDPSKGFESKAMEMAAKTWRGEWWTLGGGGTAWDGIVYDPKLKLIYIGVGNGSPLAHKWRSEGKGDNLFLCSIVAVNAETGEYVWHYQQVPEESWDYTSTQPMILADLKIDGKLRQVIMQAPKNGFFYVLDRKTGELISASPYVPNIWASHIDMRTGRPVVNPEIYLREEPVLVTPSASGGHNWNPMSYSPLTGLVYIPAHEQWLPYALATDFKPQRFRSNAGWGYSSKYSDKRAELTKRGNEREKGWLSAWDPVHQREVWRIDNERPGNGGVLTTAGNLLVQGDAGGKSLTIYRADNGNKLWQMDVQNVPIAAPITYTVKSEQYIAVNAGWGGGMALVELASGKSIHTSSARLLVFKLGANAQLPPMAEAPPMPRPPALRASEDQVKRGAELYGKTCSMCHGNQAMGGVKDLRYMTAETHKIFNDIVRGGVYKMKGMASFADVVSEDDVKAIQAYVIARANEDWGREGQK
jgi:quinohemoprotein ethanol dehydrogenase